jgi:hypothetical protein
MVQALVFILFGDYALVRSRACRGHRASSRGEPVFLRLPARFEELAVDFTVSACGITLRRSSTPETSSMTYS